MAQINYALDRIWLTVATLYTSWSLSSLGASPFMNLFAAGRLMPKCPTAPVLMYGTSEKFHIGLGTVS